MLSKVRFFIFRERECSCAYIHAGKKIKNARKTVGFYGPKPVNAVHVLSFAFSNSSSDFSDPEIVS